MAKDLTVPDPGPVLELLQAFRASKAMFAAIDLGVFDALDAGPLALPVLAKRLAVHADALERLLHACVGLHLLTHANGLYANTAAASAFLCTRSSRKLTGYLRYSNQILWKLWGNLEDAVREGTHRWQQTYGWEGPLFANFFHNEAAKREFLLGMHGQGLLSSPQVVAAFDLGRFRRLVDVGGATGHLAMAACERYPKLRAVVFDLPEAMPLAREMIGASAVAERIEVVAGDFFRDPLPEGDLYALGRILHDWAEEKIARILRTIYERLPSGGALLIAEKLLDDDKHGPPWAVLQSLNMLVCTEGKERTLAEYERLLQQAGFSEVHGCRTPSPLDAILAIKP
jgi:acetylserotonin N-methyltransferase